MVLSVAAVRSTGIRSLANQTGDVECVCFAWFQSIDMVSRRAFSHMTLSLGLRAKPSFLPPLDARRDDDLCARQIHHEGFGCPRTSCQIPRTRRWAQREATVANRT